MPVTSSRCRSGSARRADGLTVDVADRGPGIPDAEKGRVLERFARGSAGQAGRRQRARPRHRQGGGRRASGDAWPCSTVRAAGSIVRLGVPAIRPRRAAPRGACCWRSCWRGQILRTAATTSTFYPVAAAGDGTPADPRRDRPAASWSRFCATSRRYMADVAIDYVDMQTGEVYDSVVASARRARSRDQLGASTCR